MIHRCDALELSLLDQLVLPLSKQFQWKDNDLTQRLDTVLPKIMKQSDIDSWLVMCAEYNEDPVLKSLTPASMFTARRTMVLVFVLNEQGRVDRYAITRAHIGLDPWYKTIWNNPKGSSWCKDPDKAQTQMECLNALLMEVQPQKIGLNISNDFAFGDGLSHGFYQELCQGLDPSLVKRFVSAESIAVGWLETRSQMEMDAYDGIMHIINTIIDLAFSSSIIMPGVTTNTMVKYWMMETAIRYGLNPWFDFEVSVIRPGQGQSEDEMIIMPGDVLHCDVGIQYLGLCTDTQELAYICRPGENEAPQELQQMMAKVNRLQDIVVETMAVGKGGNAVLREARDKAIAEGLEPCIYTHPLGFHGHAAGTNIGLCDQQNGIGSSGDYPFHDQTAYSLELNCSFDSDYFKGKVSFGMETDILLDGDIRYIGRRQKSFHLVK